MGGQPDRLSASLSFASPRREATACAKKTAWFESGSFFKSIFLTICACAPILFGAADCARAQDGAPVVDGVPRSPGIGREALERDATGQLDIESQVEREEALLNKKNKALADRLALARAKDAQDKRMVVEAREMLQDVTKNTVTALGGVQIYYKGRILEADQVVYDRTNKRLSALGHIRMTEANGRVTQSDRLELTDDFKQGFVDSMQMENTDQTFLSAARGERDGDITLFDHGTYTACKPCEEGGLPPLWRVRAKRIIHDQGDKTIYYQDTSLQFLGVPIAYTPYFTMPDPTVKRRSGILNPQYIYTPQLGYGLGLPIYWAVAPNMDLVVKPIGLTKQGAMGEIEWAHRLANGGYSFRLDGVRQANRDMFAKPPLGSGDKKFRGSIMTNGAFSINKNWWFGWDATVISDKYFLQDYRLNSRLLADVFFRETSSTAFLTGKGERSFFDLRGYYFQGTSTRDFQPQLGLAAPVLDYNRTWAIDPNKSWGIGGQFELDANATLTSTRAALFESQQPRTFDRYNSIYNVCQLYAPDKQDPRNSKCLLRGIGGEFARGTLETSWKRAFIDPIGQVWTPFAFARGHLSYLTYDQSRQYNLYNVQNIPLSNAFQREFVGSDNVARAQLWPGGGFEYRYPLFARLGSATLTFEPIAQIIARPNAIGSRSLVNVDAQSLIFDDTNLFAWSKYSGYDRFETGTRLNYGGQATVNFQNGGFVNVMAGQSYQLAGKNGYAHPDAANVGLSSGLDTRRSDYVARVAISPASFLAVSAKGRFDAGSMRARRIDLAAAATWGPVTATAQYANYTAQPAIGFDKRRQGLIVGARYDVTKNYFVTGSVQFDLSRYQYNNNTQYWGTAPVFSIGGLNLGGGYHDECTTFTLNYSSIYQVNSTTGLPGRNQTILATLSLRTLGEVKAGASLGFVPVNDGVKSQQ